MQSCSNLSVFLMKSWNTSPDFINLPLYPNYLCHQIDSEPHHLLGIPPLVLHKLLYHKILHLNLHLHTKKLEPSIMLYFIVRAFCIASVWVMTFRSNTNKFSFRIACQVIYTSVLITHFNAQSI